MIEIKGQFFCRVIFKHLNMSKLLFDYDSEVVASWTTTCDLEERIYLDYIGRDLFREKYILDSY